MLNVLVLCLLFGPGLSQDSASGQKVKVEPEVQSYPGQTVNLPCAFTVPSGVLLTMVVWKYEPKGGEKINIAIFHPNFDPNYPESPMQGRVSFSPSPPNLASPSIQIQDVRTTDEGKYICEYATYPSGIEQGITNLVILGQNLGLKAGSDHEAQWRTELLSSVQSLVQVQKEVLKLLGVLGHQVSLLVENHQALLLQTSRIATNMQEVTRRTPTPPQEVTFKSRNN